MQRSKRAALGWAIVLGLCACGGDDLPFHELAESDPASLRHTTGGPVQGGAGTAGGHAWLGLPFARPAEGDLRWRAPQPPEAWSETRLALTQPRPCPQVVGVGRGRQGEAWGTPTGSEDCLALNVFAPAFDPNALPVGDARLPVMVWIHGGGNTIGEASTYDGSRLAVEQNVIVVAVQYRLGPFGWFRHASLRAGASPAEQSGNFGTLDLIAALLWVRDNAAAFGGNSRNVTIFGESAGGRNVFSLLLSPLAKGLFQRAISQSGSAQTLDPRAGEDSRIAARRGRPNASDAVLARLRGADPGAVDADDAAFLRSRSTDQILSAYDGERTVGMIPMPQVFADGVVLPSVTADEAFASGRYNRVPVVLGTNRDEMKLFQLGNDEQVSWMLGFLPRLKDADGYERDTERSSRQWKLRGVDEPARRLRASQGPSVFAYRFDWDEERKILWMDFPQLLGAAHGLEVPFVFGGFDLGRVSWILFPRERAAERDALAAAMRSYWANFARIGAPARGIDDDLPEWSAWDDTSPESNRLLILDTESGGGIRMSPHQVTHTSFLTAIAEDPRYAGAAERCAALEALRLRRGGLSPEDFRLGGCPEPVNDPNQESPPWKPSSSAQ
jgi:para-nitrobenzyl esterase